MPKVGNTKNIAWRISPADVPAAADTNEVPEYRPRHCFRSRPQGQDKKRARCCPALPAFRLMPRSVAKATVANSGSTAR